MSVTPDKYSWCYPSGKVAALEDRFLSGALLYNFADLYGAEALLRGLGETPYREYFQTIDDLEDAERIIADIWSQRLDEIRSICPTGAVIDIFVLEAEFRNYKSYLKNRYFELPYTRLPACRFTDDDYERLLEGLYTPAYDVFGAGTALFQGEMESGNATTSTVDWLFDAFFFGEYLEAGAETGCGIIESFVLNVSELKTAEIILRVQKERERLESVRSLFVANLPEQLAATAQSILDAPEETKLDPLRRFLTDEQVESIRTAISDPGRIGEIVQELKHFSFEQARPARAVTFGPERVFAYLLELQNELNNLKLVICGKLCFLDSGVICSRIIRPASMPT